MELSLTSIIEPIIKILHTRGASGGSATGAGGAGGHNLDRTIGTVASLTLTIGICRILNAAYKKSNNIHTCTDINTDTPGPGPGPEHHHEENVNHNNEGIVGFGITMTTSVYELVKIIIRSVLMGDGVKRLTDYSNASLSPSKEHSGICRNRIRTTDKTIVNDDSDDTNTIVSMMGSCHCKSVSFIVSTVSYEF